jgi:type I restriction enzyme, S subunit
VAFLEANDQDIQTFIANKRRMIELLKEQKNPLINHAVTGGHIPNAPLKPSGIPWLSEIPSGWEVEKIVHMGRVGNGSTPCRASRGVSSSGAAGASAALNRSAKMRFKLTPAE